MSYPRVVHHGGAEGVTGSCHQLFLSAACSVLVDCGLFQGDEARDREDLTIEFDLTSVQAVVITHVHIDHVGRLPYLLAAGYKGPIICSEPSAMLLPLVIEDALEIGFTRDKRLIERVLKQLTSQLVALPYKQWHGIYDEGGVRLRLKLQRAGHILGSAFVECDLQRPDNAERVVFSGDLGAPWSPLLPAPRSPYQADRLFLESTYGDKSHENRRQRSAALLGYLQRSIEQEGCLLIPAFSIGRTQELLYEIEHLIHKADADSPLKQLEVIVDSPLAARFTEVYRKLKPFWDAEARRRLGSGRHPLNFETLYTVGDHGEHQLTVEYLSRYRRPAVVIAASGMAAGGRIVNYLKACLGDKRHQVLFVGYQAAGTPGAALLKYGPRGGWVELEGKRYDVRAQVAALSGYSAHADQSDLVRFVLGMRRLPGNISLIHGDSAARKKLKQVLEAEYAKRGTPVVVRLA
ncbi:MBL fold metallo-hydrolase RNA specificity domain-containing protein [Oceanospirillum linum]|uniref:MBL fold hydrolase n=1 Tax=Oceanospirillum linum TaxID=966 RepID=A0A1T1H880_OCELI|nr:MBL fold metallo-hydrolase [Oceanospirillum linum]OOV85917.1 MBL fold hydrolase [Oceanospirillum linum]SEG51428.1 metallo-beta-lactamase family protein [Oleiphilus messinensis]SMP35553.1 metallo-beta-lactamase family protein [Oceanospirillum linum]